MSQSRRQYPFHLIEPKWQEFWDAQQTFRAFNPGETVPNGHPFARRHKTLPPKYYILDMFPYPSGAGLHVGHPEGYTATDILARYHRAQGFNVLHPMGWDAFGLPAEQYAIRTGQHPRRTTAANIATFKRQIKSLGFSYDWEREIDTTDPEYFRWTQWIFLQIYNSWYNPATNKAEPLTTLPYPSHLQTEADRRNYADSKRLAYVADAPVNWCPELGTVLANEEVINGKSERGGHPVIRRPMRQWMLRITTYAERLLNDLEGLDWSHSIKEMQRNWIGRSEGAEVSFRVTGDGNETSAQGGNVITVFTTRPDTLFGATYMVLAPEHSLVDQIIPSVWPENIPEEWKGDATSERNTPRQAVAAYRRYAASKSDLERTELARDKTGVFTGSYAINPLNQERIPVWIADYVLASYGTGAIMAVPGHDTRDLQFATRFGLPVRPVVQAPTGEESIGFLGDGVSINSGFLTGLPTSEAKRSVTAWLEKNGVGHKTVNFKLRDWLFSRQRYWGEPFPIVWRNGRHEAVAESALPVLPPELDDYKPTAAGDPPLARATEWLKLPDGATRETNTMPQWAGSCWYYLRFADPRNAKALSGTPAQKYWMGSAPSGDALGAGVDLYIGGAEHAVLHLLYSRFWHKVLFDLGHLTTPEPFRKLVNQGIILGEDNQKMSKARGNVVNPDDIVSEYGADAFRLYEMFLGPLEMVKPWNTKGVEGVYRFLGRVWRLFIDEHSEVAFEQAITAQGDRPELLGQLKFRADIQEIAPTDAQLKTLHACIKKVTEDLNGLRFNTAISALMVFVNDALGWLSKPQAVLRDFLILLQPFAPHLAEELFDRLRQSGGLGTADPQGALAYQPWPQHNPAFLVEDTLEIPVQVNGKLRDRVTVPAGATTRELERAAWACEKIKPFLEGKTIKKVIVVPGKLVNIVAA